MGQGSRQLSASILRHPQISGEFKSTYGKYEYSLSQSSLLVVPPLAVAGSKESTPLEVGRCIWVFARVGHRAVRAGMGVGDCEGEVSHKVRWMEDNEGNI
jgi:hypothetical protein